ncbi:MAG: S41 family peptidase [Pyrinomonadaceae bacterium]
MKIQIERGHEMLATIKKDIKDNYYNPDLHGVDLDKQFEEADAQIGKAVSGDQIYGIIAHTLFAFEDSHTYFVPPTWSMEVDYGWKMQVIGDKCYVTFVQDGSDAQNKGLRLGDQVLAIFDVLITRENLWQIKYLFYRLRPLKAMSVRVRTQSGQIQQIALLTDVKKATMATVQERRRRAEQSINGYKEQDGSVFYWEMPNFDMSSNGVDDMMKKVGEHNALILDLRGNPGGYEVTLQYLLGYFFDHNIRVGDRRGRKESKPVIAKTRGTKSYRGRVVTLVDSDTASAAEIFARVMQLEKRGIVVGDRTAGAVGESRIFSHDYVRWKNSPMSAFAVNYGVSVTISDLIMTDGTSLERIGVTPEELILPLPSDLSNGHDPALMRAGQLLGINLGPKKPKTETVKEPSLRQ